MPANQEKLSLRDITRRLANGQALPGGCAGLNPAARAYLAVRLQHGLRVPLLIVTPDSQSAETLVSDLEFFLHGAGGPVLLLPPSPLLPGRHLLPHRETEAQRLRSLYRLIVEAPPAAIVTTVGGLLQRVVPRQELGGYAELLLVDEPIERDGLIAKLVAGGYERVAIVEEPGDFAVRGAIVDIFSPLYADPLRVELDGELVASLRFFSAASQRQLERISEAVVLPAREAILPAEALGEALTRIRAQAATQELPLTTVRGIVDTLRQERSLPDLGQLLPLIQPRLETIFDYLPPRLLTLLWDPPQVEQAIEKAWEQIRHVYERALASGTLTVEPEMLYLEGRVLRERLRQLRPLPLTQLALSTLGEEEGGLDPAIQLAVEENQALSAALTLRRDGENLFEPLVRWLGERQAAGCRTLLVARTRMQAQRMSELLRYNGVTVDVAGGFEALEGAKEAPLLCVGRLSSGFVWLDEAVALLTAEEIFGSRRTPRRAAAKPHVHTELLTFEDLTQGDLVVHDEHGIGRYEGLVKLTLNGATNDFLLIGYRDEDKLYLPVDRMNMIQKYLGVDDVVPVLDRMGGKSWEKVKEKVKRSVEKIAGELLELYATRKVGQGQAFGGPDEHYHEFEAGFPYEETTDQLKAIRAVGEDLQRGVPMDRLVCGDVGYGKTEVALRSSFLAVNAGKQVAVLVPTTVLAQQHFATFSERFGRYPVNVACLSRFRSKAEQNQVIEGLARGGVDIVIGTHRLLQKDVRFKDLGLVILDEEQRFGVKQKERLKQLRQTVHVLALTATPIPRTLHMSLTGVRDISVISTPPEARQPIETHLCEWDDALIADAIRREVRRGGQIFFVHNKVQGIERMVQHVAALVPEARVDVAHGQMASDVLENAMLRFIQREIDVLVCTTIIESGLDIAAANTMIINRADTFGLAQIYQLRGRVGRSSEQAYAYLIIPRESSLSRDAQKRLRVLMEHSDLGSGFQIAMSDLQIRGGGTILGANQSGHIAAVGYDMFLKLMESAVSELKGEALPVPLEPEIQLPLSAYIPESYIPDIDGRLSLYRRLARLTEPREIADIKSELTDRFGEPPAEVGNLLLKILLRLLAIQAGVRKLELTGLVLALQCSEAHQPNPQGLVEMVLADPARFELTPDRTLRARLAREGAGLLTQTKNILKEIKARVTR